METIQFIRYANAMAQLMDYSAFIAASLQRGPHAGQYFRIILTLFYSLT